MDQIMKLCRALPLAYLMSSFAKGKGLFLFFSLGSAQD